MSRFSGPARAPLNTCSMPFRLICVARWPTWQGKPGEFVSLCHSLHIASTLVARKKNPKHDVSLLRLRCGISHLMSNDLRLHRSTKTRLMLLKVDFKLRRNLLGCKWDVRELLRILLKVNFLRNSWNPRKFKLQTFYIDWQILWDDFLRQFRSFPTTSHQPRCNFPPNFNF